MRGTLPCLVLVALLVFSAGCVSGFSETEQEPEVEVTIQHEVRSVQNPPINPIGNITITRTSDGWETSAPGVVETEEGYKTDFEGKDVTDECVKELTELVIRNQSDAKCVGEVEEEPLRSEEAVSLWTDINAAQQRVNNALDKRQSLIKELNEARESNKSDRIDVLKDELRNVNKSFDKAVDRRDSFFAVRHGSYERYTIEIKRDSTIHSAETDWIPVNTQGSESPEFKWTIRDIETSNNSTVNSYETVSQRLDRVANKVYFEARSDD